MDDDQDNDSREEINYEDDLIEVKEIEDNNHEVDEAKYENNEEVGVDNDERVWCRLVKAKQNILIFYVIFFFLVELGF